MTDSDITISHKPWRLDYDKIRRGDATAVRSWANILFNWIKSSNKDQIFDFRKSQWSWEPVKGRGGGIGRFSHPVNLEQLKSHPDKVRWPFYIEQGTDEKPKVDDESQDTAPKVETPYLGTSDQKSSIFKKSDNQEITDPGEAWTALVTIVTGFTNDAHIASAAITKWEITVQNAATIFSGDFISAYNEHLRKGAYQIDCYLPSPYSTAISDAIWGNASQMLDTVFTDVGVEVAEVEDGKIPPFEMLLNWQLFAQSGNFTNARSLIQMRVLQNVVSSWFGDYSDEPVATDLIRANAQPFDGQDILTPVLSFMIFASSTSDIGLNDKRTIVQDLASHIKKNEVDLTLHDFISNRKYILDKIDFLRQKRTPNNLQTFDVCKFRAELNNPKPKEKSASYNRNQTNRGNNGKDHPNTETSVVVPPSDIDRFAYANPHRFIPNHVDHPLNCNLGYDRNKGSNNRGRDNNRPSRSNNRDSNRNQSNQSRNSNSNNRNQNYNNGRSNSSNSRSNNDSQNRGWNNNSNNSNRGWQNNSRDYRSCDNQEEGNQFEPPQGHDEGHDDHNETNNSENDPENRSGEGKVDFDSFHRFNRLTNTVLRRINLNRVIYRKLRDESEVQHTSSPCLPIDNMLLINTFFNKLKNVKPVLILDTGADTSLISADLLFSLERCRYSRSARNPYKNSKSASGDSLVTLPHLYDIELLCNNVRIKLKDVVVAKNLPAGTNAQVLLGWSDLCDKKITYQFLTDPNTEERMYEVFMGRNKTKIMGPCPIYTKSSDNPEMSVDSFRTDSEINQHMMSRDVEISRGFRCLNLSVDPNKADAIQSWLQTSRLHRENPSYPRYSTTPLKQVNVDSWSVRVANTTSRVRDESDWRILPIKTSDIIKKCSVKSADIETMHKLEKKLVEQRKINTVHEVSIDPHGDVLPKGPEGEKMKARIRGVLERHKEVFCADTGDAGNILTTDVEIVDTGQSLTLNTARNMMNSAPESEREIICQKLDAELACGTLQRAMGRKIKNFLPIFLVPKKNATKEEVVVDASKNRMISNCKTIINSLTKHVASSTDDAEKAVRDTVGFTKSGWSFQADISDAFHCIRLPRHLQPYFAVLHPKLGPCWYTRLVQGWISSPQICRDFFTGILSNVGNIARYVDDIMGGGESFEDLLATLDSLLGTLKYYNLRLKGNKMTILTKKIPFLGRELVNGTVVPSRHHVDRLSDIKWEDMKKGKDLRPYLGLYQYISPFLWKSSDALHKLHRAAACDNKEIPWTQNDNELIRAFQASKDLLKNTIPLSPMDRSKDLYLVVDTSQIATGAILLQKVDRSDSISKYVVLGIYSRKRGDIENKTPTPSCVVELSGISSAVAHFKGQIADLNEDKSVIILTDSQSAVGCWKKYLKDNHPSSTMRISSFIASMYDIRYQMRYIPNMSQEIQLADWFSRSAANKKVCPADCKICNVAKSVTGHAYRSLSSDLATCNFKNEFVPPSESAWFHFDAMNPQEQCQFMRSFSSGTEFSREKVIHVSGTGNQIRRALSNYRVVRRKDIYPYAGTLQGLLNCQKVLSEWQKLDPTIKKTIEILKQNLHAPTKNPRVRTLVEKYKAKLDNRGILITSEDDGMDEKNRIILPVAVVKDVVTTVHDNMNHGSVNGILNMVNKIFHFAGREYFGKESPPSVSSAVKGKVNACPGCARLAPNKLSKEPFKAIEIPKTIGSVLIMDEFTRLNRKKETWKFVLVTDSLSRYSMIYDYGGHMNSSKFKEILKKIERDFMWALGETCEVDVICDELSVHASAVGTCNIQGLKIKCKESTSMSKNHLPDLDGRLAKISRIMRAELSDPKISRSEVAVRTTKKYNSTVGSEKFTPFELWRSRRQPSNINFKVNAEVLRENIARARKLNRESRDRMKGETTRRQFVPYEPFVTDYGNKLVTPLKKGDIIVPLGQFNKNDSNPLYQICAHPVFESGIDFDNQVIFTRKIGVQERSNNIHPFAFVAIHKVIDGASDESRLFLAENGAISRHRWLMFQENSPMDLKPQYTDPFSSFDHVLGSYADDAYYASSDPNFTRSDDLLSDTSTSGTDSEDEVISNVEAELREAMEDVSTDGSDAEKDDGFHVYNENLEETHYEPLSRDMSMLKKLRNAWTGTLPPISRGRTRSTSKSYSG